MLEKALHVLFEDPQDDKRLVELAKVWSAMKAGHITVGHRMDGKSELRLLNV